jgi:Fur family peroxide stress response transcriptional regulator
LLGEKDWRMTLPRDIVEARLAAFREACLQKRLRLTYQRIEVFRALASSEEHPDVETIHRFVRKRIPTISPDTIYRNLKLLAEHGLVSAAGMSHERLRFDANVDPHHHFVCVKCGRIRDFTSSDVDCTTFPVEAQAFGTPLSVHLEVKGLCSVCQKGQKS